MSPETGHAEPATKVYKERVHNEIKQREHNVYAGQSDVLQACGGAEHPRFPLIFLYLGPLWAGLMWQCCVLSESVVIRVCRQHSAGGRRSQSV